jgi:hypothetical protein
VVVVISEETGIISIVVGGQIQRSLDATSLRQHLEAIFEGKQVEDKDHGLSTVVERS